MACDETNAMGITRMSEKCPRASKTVQIASEKYIEDVVASVRDRLPMLLRCSSEVGGISLDGTLAQQEPLQIGSEGRLQTTKEHWRWENCKNSLERNSVYEAPGNLFWFSMNKPTWNGQGLPATDMVK